MRSATRSKILGKYLSARLTGEEEERVIQRAQAEGLTKSEWCRQTLLKSLEVSPDARLLLAELAALRALSLTLHLDTIKGNDLTEERLKQLVEKSEREKFAMADKRIHSYRSQELSALTAKSTGVGE